jgi:hypothetical protein
MAFLSDRSHTRRGGHPDNRVAFCSVKIALRGVDGRLRNDSLRFLI